MPLRPLSNSAFRSTLEHREQMRGNPMKRIVFGLFSVLFLYAAYIQLNDPDPALWMAIYGTAAVICLAELIGHPFPSALTGALSVAAIVYAVYLSYLFVNGHAEPMYPEKAGETVAFLETEEGREAAGLLIAATIVGFSAANSDRIPEPHDI